MARQQQQALLLKTDDRVGRRYVSRTNDSPSASQPKRPRRIPVMNKRELPALNEVLFVMDASTSPMLEITPKNLAVKKPHAQLGDSIQRAKSQLRMQVDDL